MAAFVAQRGDDMEVLSLATGTKCLGVSGMATDGSVVNDAHAEVLARRALLR